MNDINAVLKTLTWREREIFKRRQGIGGHIPASLSEIAKEFKCSRERVRQVEAKAIKKMRHPTRVAMLEGVNGPMVNLMGLSNRARSAIIRALGENATIEDIHRAAYPNPETGEFILAETKNCGATTLNEIRSWITKSFGIGAQIDHDPWINTGHHRDYWLAMLTVGVASGKIASLEYEELAGNRDIVEDAEKIIIALEWRLRKNQIGGKEIPCDSTR